MTKQHVVVIGAGISGLTSAFYLRKAGIKVTVLEKASRTGGKLGSIQEDGFLFDHAANGFLNNAPDTLKLVHDLGLEGELESAQSIAQKRHLYIHGALHVVPTSPLAFLRSDILNPLAKMRALSELLWKPSSYPQEETVYAFIRRHFGKDVADVMAQIAVQGISAGDAQALSLDAMFPKMRDIEKEHGSLLRGMQAIAKRAKESGQATRLTSFKGGMQQLIDALSNALGDAVHLNSTIDSIEKASASPANTASPESYHIHTKKGIVNADAIVLAIPSFVSGTLLAHVEGLESAAQSLRSIPYAPASVYQLGYHRVDVPHALDSFGYLVSREKRQTVRSLGVLFSSSIYPQRAPEQHVALRVIAGGARDSSFAELNDAERWQVVQDDLRISLGITAEPVYKRVQHWQQAIPQYHLGHRNKVNNVVKRAENKGIYLTGNALYGVAVNDCIRDAHRVCHRVCQEH